MKRRVNVTVIHEDCVFVLPLHNQELTKQTWYTCTPEPLKVLILIIYSDVIMLPSNHRATGLNKQFFKIMHL